MPRLTFVEFFLNICGALDWKNMTFSPCFPFVQPEL